MNYTQTPELLHQQCAQRIKDRAMLKDMAARFELRAEVRRKSERKRLKRIIADVETVLVAKAIDGMKNPSLELQRQIIREIRA